MFKLKTVITPVALCLSLVLSSHALAKPDHGHERHKMAKVFSQLSLTDTQKQDIKQIFKQSREDRKAKGPKDHSFRKEIADLVHSPEWDQQAVEALLAEQQTIMAEMGLKRAENKHAVLSVLTDEQRAELASLKEERKELGETKGKRGHKGKNKAKGNKRGKGLARHLSAEQTSAIESIKEETKANAEALKDKLKAFKQAEKALVTSADFNAESWLALSEEYKADFLAMAVLQAKTKNQIWNVLTPEQQAKMQRMEKRLQKGKRMGHRAGEGKGKRQLTDA